MKQRPRIYYTESDKALMWDRWQKGDSLHAIAHLFDRGHSSVQRILGEAGGIRPAQTNILLGANKNEGDDNGADTIG